MRAFEYASPTSTKQALSLLGAASGGALVLAGGTDLLALMKDDIVHPKRLVNIKEIREYIIHKPLESGWGIGKSERHNTPFKRPISGPESSFPFITFCYSDQMVSMTEIDFGIDFGFSWRVEEITDEG